MTNQIEKTPQEEAFETIIALPKLNTTQMAEAFRKAANHAEKINKAVKIIKDSLNERGLPW